MDKYHIIDPNNGELYNSFNDIKEATQIIKDIAYECDIAIMSVTVQTYGTLVVKDTIELFRNNSK